MAAGVYTFGQDLLSLAATVIPLDSPQYFHNFNAQQKKGPPRRAARQTEYDGVSLHEGRHHRPFNAIFDFLQILNQGALARLTGAVT